MKFPGIENGKIYKALVCNRCGEVYFVKHIGTRHFDGGFTTVEDFEAVQEEWGWHKETGTLCPNCESKYQRYCMDFMQETQKMTGGVDK